MRVAQTITTTPATADAMQRPHVAMLRRHPSPPSSGSAVNCNASTDAPITNHRRTHSMLAEAAKESREMAIGFGRMRKGVPPL